MEEQIKLHERVARLETNVETIMTNHLPHIQSALDDGFKKQEEKMDKLKAMFWGVVILLIGNLIVLVKDSFIK